MPREETEKLLRQLPLKQPTDKFDQRMQELISNSAEEVEPNQRNQAVRIQRQFSAAHWIPIVVSSLLFLLLGFYLGQQKNDPSPIASDLQKTVGVIHEWVQQVAQARPEREPNGSTQSDPGVESNLDKDDASAGNSDLESVENGARPDGPFAKSDLRQISPENRTESQKRLAAEQSQVSSGSTKKTIVQDQLIFLSDGSAARRVRSVYMKKYRVFDDESDSFFEIELPRQTIEITPVSGL